MFTAVDLVELGRRNFALSAVPFPMLITLDCVLVSWNRGNNRILLEITVGIKDKHNIHREFVWQTRMEVDGMSTIREGKFIWITCCYSGQLL